MTRRAWLRLLASGLLFAAVDARARHHHASDSPFVVGLAPNISARGILAAYQPVRDFLRARLGRLVECYTAPDFAEFYSRTTLGEYDLALMPAHLARLAQMEAGLTPLAQFSARQDGLVIVRRDAPFQRPSDLMGRAIAMADPLALVTIRGQRWLRDHVAGQTVSPKRNLFLTHHDAAILAVANGEVDAAIISSIPYYFSRPEARARVRILTTIGQFPSNFFVSSKFLTPGDVEVVKEALMTFPHSSPAAKRFIDQYRLVGVEAVTPPHLRALDHDARAARLLLDARVAEPSASHS